MVPRRHCAGERIGGCSLVSPETKPWRKGIPPSWRRGRDLAPLELRGSRQAGRPASRAENHRRRKGRRPCRWGGCPAQRKRGTHRLHHPDDIWHTLNSTHPTRYHVSKG